MHACMPGCWLEVSLRTEAPATAQNDQDFYVVFVPPRKNAELVSKFHAALHASLAALPTLAYNFWFPVDPSQS
jgi:hypothetical protein